MYDIYRLLCVQWKTPDDGEKNCPKHVEFHSKNKFEKLVHLVGFIIRICHDARSHERQIWTYLSYGGTDSSVDEVTTFWTTEEMCFDSRHGRPFSFLQLSDSYGPILWVPQGFSLSDNETGALVWPLTYI